MHEPGKEAQAKPKGFFRSLAERIDAKLKEKAGHGSCCASKEGKVEKPDKTSCCD